MDKKKPTREQLIELAKRDPEAIADLVLMLWDRVEALEAKVAQLERNSRNSNKPPSSDSGNFTNPPKPKSQRGRSGRKPGGQKGHPGQRLEQVSNPDQVITHTIPEEGRCEKCGTSLSLADQSQLEYECRQVFELPAIRLEITEHRAEVLVCPTCGTRNTADFPVGVEAPTQYGPGVRATVLYLNAFQLIPFKRLSDLCADLFNFRPSLGTLVNFVKAGGRDAAIAMEPIREALVDSDIGHADETGCRVDGKRHWLHVLSTTSLTSFHIDKKRGFEGMDRPGLLSRFQGKLVHDFWASYYQLIGCSHFACGAHLQRELTYLQEEMEQPWAGEMKDLMLEAKELRKREDRRERGARHVIGTRTRARIRHRYHDIVTAGKKMNPEPPPTPGKRGRPKRSKALNLLLRLEASYDEIMGYFEQEGIPFDNNLAERDLRMMKVREKISGTFRSEGHPEFFADIRSVISTAQKQSQGILELLTGMIRNPVELGETLAAAPNRPE